MLHHARVILGEQGDVERPAAGRDVMEADLVAERGLAGAGRALDDVKAAFEEAAAAQDDIETGDPARHPLELLAVHLAHGRDRVHMPRQGHSEYPRTFVVVMKSLIGAVGGEAREIDRIVQHLRQRVRLAKAEIIGREDAPQDDQSNVRGRVIKRPAAQQYVHRTALQRAEQGGLGNAAPECFQRLTRAPVVALGVATGHHSGIHGTGRSAGNGLDLEPRFLERPVQHAPGEGAMRPTAL